MLKCLSSVGFVHSYYKRWKTNIFILKIIPYSGNIITYAFCDNKNLLWKIQIFLIIKYIKGHTNCYFPGLLLKHKFDCKWENCQDFDKKLLEIKQILSYDIFETYKIIVNKILKEILTK